MMKTIFGGAASALEKLSAASMNESKRRLVMRQKRALRPQPLSKCGVGFSKVPLLRFEHAEEELLLNAGELNHLTEYFGIVDEFKSIRHKRAMKAVVALHEEEIAFL